MIDFYAHLESDACVQEFPHNSQYSFKDRLPYPISMKERGWRMGLANVSYALSYPRRFPTISLEKRENISSGETLV